MTSQDWEKTRNLPSMRGEGGFRARPIVNFSAFVNTAAGVFRDEPRIGNFFREHMQAEAKRRSGPDFFGKVTPIEYQAHGIFSQVLDRFKRNGPAGYSYRMVCVGEASLSHEEATSLQSLTCIPVVVSDEGPSLLRRLSQRRKSTEERRIVYDTNPSDDVIFVETTARFATPKRTPPLGGGRESESLSWITRYAAYRYTKEGIVPIGDQLFTGSSEALPYDLLMDPVKLSEFVLPQNLHAVVSLPRVLQEKSSRSNYSK